MKKTLLALAIAATAFAGCAKSVTTAPAEPMSPPSAAEPAAPAPDAAAPATSDTAAPATETETPEQPAGQ